MLHVLAGIGVAGVEVQICALGVLFIQGIVVAGVDQLDVPFNLTFSRAAICEVEDPDVHLSNLEHTDVGGEQLGVLLMMQWVVVVGCTEEVGVLITLGVAAAEVLNFKLPLKDC